MFSLNDMFQRLRRNIDREFTRRFFGDDCVDSKPERETITIRQQDAEAIKEALVNAPDNGVVHLPVAPEPRSAPIADKASKPAYRTPEGMSSSRRRPKRN